MQERYEHAFANVAADLAAVEDIRVLDFNGHQIMTNFSLDELGEPIKFGGCGRVPPEAVELEAERAASRSRRPERQPDHVRSSCP